MALSQAEALAQIKEDLGLDIDYDTQEPTPLLARAAHDLGIELPGRGVRSDIYYVCLELGIETGWGLAPAEAPSAQPSLDSGEAEAELSHSAKVRAIFEKFDVDGDGRLSFHEGSAYSLAKEGEPLDDDTWAEVCGSLGFDGADGMALEHFERMYYSSARGEGNDINVDYMRLCEGLRITISAAPI